MGKLAVLIVIFLASTFGLISLVVPEPVTITFTTTSHETFTRSQAFTLTNPLTMTQSLFCGFYMNCGGTRLTTATVSEVQTWTSYSVFPYGSYAVRCFTQTYIVGGYTYTYSTGYCVPFVATPVTVTLSPLVLVSVTLSSVTSSLTSTGYMTKRMSPISTGSVYQVAAVALVVVLAVSLLMMGLNWQKRKQPKITEVKTIDSTTEKAVSSKSVCIEFKHR